MTLSCETCEKTFKTAKNLQKHICNICKNCGKTFTRRENLIKHTSSQNFTQCQLCKQSYKSHQTLQHHRCSYCSLCQYNFSTYQKKIVHSCKNVTSKKHVPYTDNQSRTVSLEQKHTQCFQPATSSNQTNNFSTAISIKEDCETDTGHQEQKYEHHFKQSNKETSNLLSDNSHSDIVTADSVHIENQYYEPVRSSWQKKQCDYLNIHGKIVFEADTVLKKLQKPSTVKFIKGDGNCFFRCISYIVTGSEENYHYIRSAIVSHMKKNSSLFRMLMTDNRSVFQYIQNSKMDQDKTWATHVEIFAAAHFLKTSIYVYSLTDVSGRYQWLQHSPKFVERGCPQSNQNIYINHRNRNHYEVVLDVDSIPCEIPASFCANSRILKEIQNQVNRTVEKSKCEHKYTESSITCTAEKDIKLEECQSQKQEYERMRKREWRKTERNRNLENERKRMNLELKEKDRNVKRQKRTKEEVRNQENQKKRMNLELKEKDRNIKRQKRTKEEVRNQENERKRESFKGRQVEKIIKKEKRTSLDVRNQENVKKRMNLKGREVEKIIKKEKRTSQDVRNQENVKKRMNLKGREVEKIIKKEKRTSQDVRNQENERKRQDFDNRYREKEYKQIKRTDLVYRNEENERKLSKKNALLSEDNLIQSFHTSVQNGPSYICTCCDQLWYRESVRLKYNLHIKDEQLQNKIFTGCTSAENKEWICLTCFSYAKQQKLPPLSKFYTKFPPKPQVLNLTNLEERLISPRIPFMQLHELPRGGQISLSGNVVNVPANINTTVTHLPRNYDENATIALKLKRKLSNQHYVNFQNIRPEKVRLALSYLIDNSHLYKEEGITIDENWDVPTLETENSPAQKEEVKVTDEWDETDLIEQSAGTLDTMVQPQDPFSEDPSVFSFAPAEGNHPLSIFIDKHSEELSFPTIFCGEKRLESKTSYSEICKSELRRSDRRVAGHIPNLFFKLKKLQAKHINDKSNLVLRKVKGSLKKTAAELKSPEDVQKLCHLDEGYRIFKNLRGSPPYWEKTKKDLFAMLRVLGIPTWFMSFSSAETRWIHLLKILSQTVNGKTLSTEEISNLTFFQKSEMIRKDPVTCARHFHHQVKRLINTILLSSSNPVGKVMDYFYKVEFQMRGSPHIHMLVWVENAPKLDDSGENAGTIIEYVDEYISCERDPSLDLLVSLQEHNHSRTCKKKGESICRFSYPIPPMGETCILEPLDDALTTEEKQVAVGNWKKISKKLDNFRKETVLTMSFNEFLETIQMTEESYIKAVRSTLHAKKIFLKRDVHETRLNAYNKTLLQCWRANIDIQFVLDAYACAVYIVTYIAKSQRGMSNLLYHAVQEARDGNNNLSKQVRSLGHKFLNHVEVSAQEAVYFILQMPLKQSSRDVVFVNTSPPEERVIMLKSLHVIKNMPDDSTDIETKSLLKRYAERPKGLENVCLADFCSQYKIVYKRKTPEKGQCDDDDDDYEDEKELTVLNFKLPDGNSLRKRKRSIILRYVRYQQSLDQENYFREILLLFHHWRQEMLIIGDSDSYTSRYLSIHKNSNIETKMKEYNHNCVEIEQAMEDASSLMREQLMAGWNTIAPQTQSHEEEDENEGEKDSHEYAALAPSSEEMQQFSDFSNDVPVSKLELIKNSVPDEEYLKQCQCLNADQRKFFLYILYQVKTSEKPIYVFLSGGAGVGKTVVVRTIYQALIRWFNLKPGSNPDDAKVLLAAPTGKAAYLIKGNTLHSVFAIPANQGFSYTPLASDKLNTLRSKFCQVKFIIIDEVSMVGNRMFSFINQRLQQIMGCTQVFGGISILAVGDLYQLKPVFDGWIFSNLNDAYGPLATNLWMENFSMFELIKIMRQRDSKDFAELLNRFRENKQTRADIKLLETRRIGTDITHPSYPIQIPHIYLTRKNVDTHNMVVCENQQARRISNESIDVVLGDVTPEVKLNILLKIPKDTSKTMNLSSKVETALGLRNELSCNVDIEDGMANGAPCILTAVGPRDKTGRYRHLWVQFEDESMGQKCRKDNKTLYTKNINPGWTPLMRVKRQFSVGKYKAAKVMRDQFPIRCAAAKTCHRSQGDTMESLVVDFSGKKFPHAHYVGLTRVTKLENLSMRCLNIENLKVDKLVVAEMERLRSSPLLISNPLVDDNNNNTFSILFQNVRSLRKHFPDIMSYEIYKQADINIFSETKLADKDLSDLYQMPDFFLHRYDSTENSAYGLVVYSRNDINQNVIHQCTRHTSGYIEMVIMGVETGLSNIPQISVAGIYVSPKTTKEELKRCLCKLVDVVIQKKQPYVVIGDLNVDLLNIQPHFIMDILQCSQVIQKVTTDHVSLLDHIYLSRELQSLQYKSGVIESHFSDHKAVYISFEKVQQP